MNPNERVTISFFRPGHALLRKETRLIRAILGGWALLGFGLPLLVWLCGLGDPNGFGESWLTHSRFPFGFPLHYWLLAQGATLGFVLLCQLYCRLWDQQVRSAQPRWAPSAREDGKE